jgi:hypothetical protein
MGKTVIEELIISLGLDAKALEDSKALEAINNMRQAVKGLDDDLKSVEKTLGGFGKIKLGVFDKPTRIPKPVAPGDPSASTSQSKPIKVETVPSKEERQERRKKPLKNFRNILDMMPGFASVVYMAKEIFSLANKIMAMFGESNASARELKTMSDKSGLKTQTLQTFGLMATKFGGTMEETTKEIENLITGIPIFGGGSLPALLERMPVPTHVQGKLREPEDIMKDVVAGVTARVQGDKNKAARFANEVGMSYSTIMAMSQGWDKYIEAQRGYLKSGAILSESVQQDLAKITEKQLETKQKIDTVKAQISQQNAGIQKAWQDVQVGMWKSLLEMSQNKMSTGSAALLGPLGIQALGINLFKNIGKELYQSWKTPGTTNSVNVPKSSDATFRGQNSMPTSAVINIYGTPTNQSKVDMKLNTKPGPYRENLVRVQ